MKTFSSILSPTIEIADTKGTGEIPLFNYAYIRDYDRYYFIDDISWSEGIWSISMHTDILASFRTDIRSSRQYVLRSASRYDDSISDTLYMTKAVGYSRSMSQSEYAGISGFPNGVNYYLYNNTSITGSTSNYFNEAYTSGEFVVGIIGNNTSGVTYYAFTNNGYKDFINKITTFEPSTMTDVSGPLGNAIFDPVQYITSVKWYPDVYYNTTTTTSIKLAGYTITLGVGGHVINPSDVVAYYAYIDVPEPDVNRKYLKLSPFREVNLIFQPFGSIPLDTTKLFNSDSVLVEWLMDFCTGQAILNVYRGEEQYRTADGLIYTTTADYGVDIPISTLKMDWKAGLALSAMQWISSKAGWSSGPTGETVLDGLIADGTVTQADLTAAGITTATTPKSMYDTVMDFSAAALGQLSTAGAIGSFLGYMYGKPKIEVWFNYQVAYDDSRFGRPLYQTAILSELSGYVICQSPTITFSANHPLEAEQIGILRMLSSGIYLE